MIQLYSLKRNEEIEMVINILEYTYLHCFHACLNPFSDFFKLLAFSYIQHLNFKFYSEPFIV